MRTLKLSFSFILILLATLANASTVSVENVQKYISLSGLNATMQAMPDYVAQQMQLEALTNDDELTIEVVTEAFNRALNDTNGYAIAERYLLNRSDNKHLTQTLTFLESDLGRTIVQAEAKANDPAFMVESQAYALELSKNPPSETRQALIKGLVDALQMEEATIKMIKTMTFSSAEFLKQYTPEAEELLENAMNAEWSKMEPMLRAQMTEYVIFSSYYSYKDITDQELETYLTFLKSEAGQVYFESYMDIFSLYFTELLQNMLKVIIEKADEQG